jgi:hypothetical protein
MRSRALILRSHRVFAAAVLLLHLGAAAQAAAAAETTGKKDLRSARTAVREGRLADGLEAYERILESTATDKQRFEPLYNTVLILLASEPNAATGETVRQRLYDLGALVASGDHGHELEIRALAALVGTASALEASAEERERELVAALAAGDLARDEQRSTAEALVALEELVDTETKEALLLEQRLATAEHHLATREEQLQAKIDELGQCAAEMKLVLDQLDGTHQNELQMLQVVIRKNEELAEKTKQLALKERTLADQAQQLALKEEEIHKREEVIREVTERVLGKDPTDS